MADHVNTWALVLAAGEGTRLRSLTTDSGERHVPKQFCSLNGGRTLLEDAIARAGMITPEAFICAIVAEQHREWWTSPLAHLPPGNVVSQPLNRGTAIGILYPLLQILGRDSDARIVLLPSDHYFRQEQVLRKSLQKALKQLAHNEGGATILLGLQPTEADPDLGYIIPGELAAGGGCAIARFIEKPPVELAGQIIVDGGLWNTFIIAASGRGLLNLFRQCYPEIVESLQRVIAAQGRAAQCTAALQDFYERLPHIDFSRNVLEACSASLGLVYVPACGWSDLGTPKRVADTLRRLDPNERRGLTASASNAPINLASRYAHYERDSKFAGAQARA